VREQRRHPGLAESSGSGGTDATNASWRPRWLWGSSLDSRGTDPGDIIAYPRGRTVTVVTASSAPTYRLSSGWPCLAPRWAADSGVWRRYQATVSSRCLS